MSEVYWITGGELPLPVEAFSDHLNAAGIRPGWIDEAHWVSIPGQSLPEINPGLPVFSWPVGPDAAQRLLRFLLTDLSDGPNEMLLLGELQSERANFCLLGSPQAAGRHNLLPRFRLSALPSIGAGRPEDHLSRWSQHLEGLLIDPQTVGWVSAPGGYAIAFPGYFQQAEWLENQPAAGLLTRLHLLLARLDETRSPAGLLVATEAVAAATLIERI